MPRKEATVTRAAIFLPLLMLNIYFLSSGETALFRKLSGYHVTSPITRSIPCSEGRCSLLLCVVYCVSGGCNGVSYNAKDQICHLHNKPIYSPEVTYEASPDWEYMMLRSDFVMYNEWVLVFRGTSQINQSAYDTWESPGYDDHPALCHDVPVGCLTVNGSNPCDRHFKSKLVDMWDTYNIDQVKVVLYENGVAMESINFNGSETSSATWFKQSGITSSSWNDILSGTFQYFSIDGDAGVFHRWYICNNVNGCSASSGWMVVMDKNIVICNWQNSLRSGYPVFMYASNETVWDTGAYREADVMAIFVKLLP